VKRTAILLAVAAAVLVAAGGVAFVMLRPHGSTAPSTAARTGAAPVSTVDTRTVAQKAEDTFIGTTAAHLCNVQFTVYDDPAALAKAYSSVPQYPGLTAQQVSAFQQRLTTDAAFSARLTRQLETACHPATK
jgi:hypothetical protein